MTFTCSTCGRQWDAESASQNEYECLRKCGGTLRPEEGSASGEAEDPLDHLPYPAALAVRRFMQAPQDERSAWDRITLFKEAVEATVKGFCVYGVGAYLAGTFRSIGEDERLLSFLVRPSLGPGGDARSTRRAWTG